MKWLTYAPLLLDCGHHEPEGKAVKKCAALQTDQANKNLQPLVVKPCAPPKAATATIEGKTGDKNL